MVERFLTEKDYAEGTAAKHFFFSSIVMLNIGVFHGPGYVDASGLAGHSAPTIFRGCISVESVRCTCTS